MSVAVKSGGAMETTLPSSWYYSDEIFALERERIFCREWVCAVSQWNRCGRWPATFAGTGLAVLGKARDGEGSQKPRTRSVRVGSRKPS